MTKKYLDSNGLSYFWGKLKNYFQAKLVSGTNIKTINSVSILGSGNIDIQGGGGETYRINGTYDPTAQPSGDYVIDGSVYPAEDVYDAVQDGMNLVLSLDGSIYTEYNVGYLSVDNNPTQMIVQFMKSANHGYASYTIQINLTTNPKSYGYCYSGGDRFAFGYSTSGNNRAVMRQENTNKMYVWAQAPLLSGSAIVDGVTATTQASGDNSTKLATTAYVDGGLSGKSGATNWLNGSSTGSVRTSGSAAENSNYTIGDYAVAEGIGTKASGNYSHAEGDLAIAPGSCAHAEGIGTKASGNYSHAEGSRTTASGSSSHAEGYATTASGDYSHAGGYGATARRKSQTAIGEYNVLDPNGTTSTRGDYAFIIGNGTSSSARSNAYAVDWDGNSMQQGRATTVDMSSADIADFITGLGGLGTLIFNAIYPVGSYYETSDSTFDPNVTFGGTWEKEEEGRVHIGSGTNYAIGATGGEATHTLTSSESGVPAHGHSHTLKLPNHVHQTVGGSWVVWDTGSNTTHNGVAHYYGTTPFESSNKYTGNPTSTPSISGSVSDNTAADASSAHNNMQPYVVVNRWHRTA